MSWVAIELRNHNLDSLRWNHLGTPWKRFRKPKKHESRVFLQPQQLLESFNTAAKKQIWSYIAKAKVVYLSLTHQIL